MRLKSLILGAASLVALAASPAVAQELTAITGGRVLTGTSVIENGTVVIQNGRVVSVGTGAAPSGARVIDARGKVVAPGFVDVMAAGPFSSWRHEHRFEPAGVGTTLVDHITYTPVLGAVGALGNVVIEDHLDRMFRYRHATTRHDIAFARALATDTGGASSVRRRIGITGARGLIGQELTSLLSVLGHDVVPVVRAEAGALDDVSADPTPQRAVRWDPETGRVAGADGLFAVVHLAGENIADGRLSAEKKARLWRGRVDQTAGLVRALAALAQPPAVFVAASAVGAYGDRGADVVDEDSPAPTGAAANFLSELCAAWEQAARGPAPWRTTVVRVGVAQSLRGGALARLAPVFSAGGGAVLGDGRGFTPAVAVDDVAAVFARAIFDARVGDVVNAVGPAPVTQAEYAHTLASLLRRPCLLKVPRAALRLGFGEFGERLLDSQRVAPTRLRALGHSFRHDTLATGLAHQLGVAMRATQGR